MLPLRVSIPEDVVSEYLDGEAVLLHLGTGTYFTLNSSGSRIWQLIEGSTDITKLVETLSSEFDVDVETMTSDLDELISELGSRGLLLIG